MAVSELGDTKEQKPCPILKDKQDGNAARQRISLKNKYFSLSGRKIIETLKEGNIRRCVMNDINRTRKYR